MSSVLCVAPCDLVPQRLGIDAVRSRTLSGLPVGATRRELRAEGAGSGDHTESGGYEGVQRAVDVAMAVLEADSGDGGRGSAGW